MMRAGRIIRKTLLVGFCSAAFCLGTLGISSYLSLPKSARYWRLGNLFASCGYSVCWTSFSHGPFSQNYTSVRIGYGVVEFNHGYHNANQPVPREYVLINYRSFDVSWRAVTPWVHSFSLGETPETTQFRKSPEVTYHLGIPGWFAILGFVYPIFAFIRRPWRRYRRRVKGQCLKCSYNLTGNVTGICPECGTAK